MGILKQYMHPVYKKLQVKCQKISFQSVRLNETLQHGHQTRMPLWSRNFNLKRKT